MAVKQKYKELFQADNEDSYYILRSSNLKSVARTAFDDAVKNYYEELKKRNNMTNASNTLKAGGGSTGGIEQSDTEKAIEIMQRLNKSQKERHLRYLEQMLSGETNSAWRKGAGVGSSNVTKNRHDMKYNEETLADDLEEAGFSLDLQERMADLFHQQVEAKQNYLKEGLEGIFEDHPEYLAVVDADSAISMLVERIDDLQDFIAEVESESEMIREELNEHAEQLQESELFERAKPTRTVRSYIDEDFEANPDNEFAYFNEETKQTYTSPQMKNYLDAVNRSFPKQ